MYEPMNQQNQLTIINYLSDLHVWTRILFLWTVELKHSSF